MAGNSFVGSSTSSIINISLWMIPCVGSQSFLAQWLFQLPPRTVLRTTCSRASRSPCVRPIYISGLWGNMVCSFHLPTVLWWSGLGKRWSILDGFIFDITISLFVEYVVYDYMLNQTWYVLTVGGDLYFLSLNLPILKRTDHLETNVLYQLGCKAHEHDFGMSGSLQLFGNQMLPSWSETFSFAPKNSFPVPLDHEHGSGIFGVLRA